MVIHGPCFVAAGVPAGGQHVNMGVDESGHYGAVSCIISVHTPWEKRCGLRPHQSDFIPIDDHDPIGQYLTVGAVDYSVGFNRPHVRIRHRYPLPVLESNFIDLRSLG
jgi:hypothetical protein